MIGADFHVRCSHPVEIGDRVGISARVAIGDLGAELHPELMRAEDGDLAVRIHAGAIIGIGAILMPGVTIGERAAVGAGSVVVADVPARAVVFGNPARVVGRWDGVTGRWVPGAVASAR
ncbi:MAG: hypothetical protein GXY03_13775 [Solirubrobacterales bacterium]|nr:hypothetical protein [Solirubrobacterales bacterium]